MRKEVIRELGYGHLLDLIDRGICPFCFQQVDETLLNSEESRAEFKVSGICQSCYDVFGSDLLDRWTKMTSEAQVELVLKIIDRRIAIEGFQRGST